MENYSKLITKLDGLVSTSKNLDEDQINSNESLLIQLLKTFEEINYIIQNYNLEQEDCITIVICSTSLKPLSEDLFIKICKVFISLYEKQALRFSRKSSEEIILFISNNILSFMCNESIISIALEVINVALKNYEGCLVKVRDSLCSNPGLLINAIEKKISKNCTLEGLRILQLLTYRPPDDINLSTQFISNCQKTSLSLLKNTSLLEAKSDVDCQISVACLSVIYNVVLHYPDEALTGLIVNVCQPYIFYRLRKVPKSQFSDYEKQDISDFLDDETDRDNKKTSVVNRKRKRRLRHKKKCVPLSMIPGISEKKTVHHSSFNFNRNFSDSQLVSLKPQWMKTEQTTNIEKQIVNNIVDNAELLDTPLTGDNLKLTDLATNFDALKIKQDNSSLNPLNIKQPESSRILKQIYSSESVNNKQDDSFSDASVRQCALHLMNAVIEAAGKQNKFSFWPQLMCQEPSIMACILRDPDLSSRMAALQVINAFLIDSNKILSLSTDSDDLGSFTTFGKQMGTSIRSLHRCLALALLSEKTSQVLIRILKTLELLFENVNYSKLKAGLLSKVVVHVKYFLKYKDNIVRANAFSAMVSFLRIKPKIEEIEAILLRYQVPLCKAIKYLPEVEPLPPYEEVYPEEDEIQSQTTSSDECFSSDSNTKSGSPTTTVLWILQRCVDSLYDEDSSSGTFTQVKIQSLKVINALISEHFNLMQSSIPVIQNIINVYSSPPSSSQLPIEECLIERIYLLLGSVINTMNCHQDSSDTKAGLHFSKEELLKFWLWALNNPLANILAFPEEHLNKDGIVDHMVYLKGNQEICTTKIFLAGASVLSNASAYIFQEIGEQYIRNILKTTMFLVTHPIIEHNLCGIRIIGLTVGFPTVQDSLFGVKIVQAAIHTSCQILSCEQFVKKDRLLAAWVLANISASLNPYRITLASSNGDLFLNKSMILKFFDAAIIGCNDKDTIKPPSIRSLGNLISYLSTDFASDTDIKKYIDVVVNLLVNNCVSAHMKSRWNACHALARILKCANISFDKAEWMEYLISSLSGLVENFKNYKVRILACSALCNISHRRYFGDSYLTVWKAFVNGVYNLRNICGAQEVNHRDDLICQLCYGICHLITLIQFDDLENMQEILEANYDILKSTMKQGDRLIPPEKANCFIKAVEHVNHLLDKDVIALCKDRTLKNILNIF